jgi:hypothetical protein
MKCSIELSRRLCLLLIFSAVLCVSSVNGHAQCSGPDQLDYDFVLTTLDYAVPAFLPAWRDAGAWQQVYCQQSPSFRGADHDCNGIDDDDNFDLLAAIVDGTAASLGGLSPTKVSTVRDAFYANRGTVLSTEFLIPRVKISAYGSTVFDGAVWTNSTINVAGQSVYVPSIWTLLEDQNATFKEGFVLLLTAYMTCGDGSSVTHVQSLLQVLLGRFMSDILPIILMNLKDSAESLSFDESIAENAGPVGSTDNQGEQTLTEGGVTEKCSPNIDITVRVNGIPVRVQVNGCDLDFGVAFFASTFDCGRFQCLPWILGSGGDLNGDGVTNGASYGAAGRQRWVWMEQEGIANPPIEIVTPPLSTEVWAGDPVALSLAYAGGQVGGTVAYQWEVTNLSSFPRIAVVSTAPIFSLDYAVPGYSAVYTATVCDGLWKRRSAPAVLTIYSRPFAIVEQPVGNDALLPYESYTLSVRVVGGTSVPSYQWQRETGSGFENIGGNSRVLVLDPLALTDTGRYRCLITGSDGGGTVVLTSDTVQVTVLDVLRFAQQPVGGRIYVGDPFTFRVAIEGPIVGEPHFVWFKNDVEIPDSDSAEYVLESATLADAGVYRCRVYDDVDARLSKPAVLEVAEHLSILEQPVGGSGFQGNRFTFQVLAQGGLGPTRYQWYQNGVAVPGATAPQLVLEPLLDTHAGDYYVEISDDFESIVSDTVALVVAPPFFFFTQPVGARKYAGDQHTLLVQVFGGTPPFHYEWLHNGVPVGEDANTLVLDPLRVEDSGTYVCKVSDQLGFAFSQPAVLEVAEHISFIAQPQDVRAYIGEDVEFSVEVQGGLGTVRYTWKKGTTVFPDSSPVLHLSSVLLGDAGEYYCEVSDDFETVTSDTATLTLASPLTFVQQPQDRVAFTGATVNFSVSVTGGMGAYHYQWFHNDTPSGMDSPVFSLAALECNDQGTVRVEVTDDIKTTSSRVAALTVFRALPDEGIAVTAQLSGDQVVPPSGSTATGTAEGVLRPATAGNTQQFILNMSISHNVRSASGGGIYSGLPGTNGAQLFTLPLDTNPYVFSRTLTNTQAADLVSGRWYLLIRSTDFISGEIRGQLTADTAGLICESGEEGAPEGVSEGTSEGSQEGVTEGTIEGNQEGSFEGNAEGVIEGGVEGAEGEGSGNEGTVEGSTEGIPLEGAFEGSSEGNNPRAVHSADQNADGRINLSELLRLIQFFNAGGYHCAVPPEVTEDGYVPGTGIDRQCAPHSADYNPADWVINLSELLRVIQFFNAGGYHYCPEAGTEDGYCVGAA